MFVVSYGDILRRQASCFKRGFRRCYQQLGFIFYFRGLKNDKQKPAAQKKQSQSPVFWLD